MPYTLVSIYQRCQKTVPRIRIWRSSTTLCALPGGLCSPAKTAHFATGGQRRRTLPSGLLQRLRRWSCLSLKSQSVGASVSFLEAAIPPQPWRTTMTPQALAERILTSTDVAFLATCDADQPRVRPVNVAL